MQGVAGMTRVQALDLARSFNIPMGEDFHTLPWGTVASIRAAADSVKYRPGKNAPGSRARMFYQYLNSRKG